jgi:hypothetical protein
MLLAGGFCRDLFRTSFECVRASAATLIELAKCNASTILLLHPSSYIIVRENIADMPDAR